VEISTANGEVVGTFSTGETITLSAYPFEKVPVPGAKAIVGLRPEHFARPAETSAESAIAIEAPLRTVERTGSDAILSLKFAGGLLAVRAEPDRAAGMKAGQMVSVRYPKTKLNLFDAQTGQRM